MRRRMIVAALAVATIAVLVSGCATPQPRVVADTVVRVAVDGPLSTLNLSGEAPSGSSDAAVDWLTHGQFYTYDAQSQLVADSSFGTVTVLPGDDFDVRYSLADSATWSDGVPVGAADLMLAWVAASGALDALLDPSDRFEAPRAVPVPEPALFPAVGDEGRSLTVYYGAEVYGWQTMLNPRVPAHALGSLVWGIDDPAKANAAVIAAVLDKDKDALAKLAEAWNTAFDANSLPAEQSLLLSSGPYAVTAWSGSETTLSASPDYRGARQPLVETIKLVTIDDPLDAVAAFEAGELDIIAPAPSTEVQAALLSVAGATVLTGNDTAVEHIDLQIVGGRSGVFANQQVREAFLLTLPRQQIVTELLGDLYEDAAPQSSFLIAQTSPDYADVVAANGSATYSEPDPQAAAQLLVEAQVSSPEVCVLFDAQDEDRVLEFGLIAESASMAGFVVTDCSTDDVASSLGRSGAYDAALFGWDAPDPSAAWLSDVYSSAGSTNLSGYSNEKVDGLIDALSSATDPAKRADILATIDAELWSDAYGAPLFQHAALTAFGERVSGVSRSPLPSGVFWNATDWVPVTSE